MRSLLGVFVCILASALTGPAAPLENGNLFGKVTDELGGAISDAYVTVHWDPSGSSTGLESNVGLKHDLFLRTDKTGTYAFDVPPGFYDVFVTSPAFTPSCKKIRVQPGSTAMFSPKLAASAIVGKEIGTMISSH